MFIAQQLRKQNIVEYLLYMWQIEDLIRAYGLDMDKINENVIRPYQLSDENKKMLYEWYESLMDMMRAENVQQSGHIQLNKNTVILLEEFHAELLQSGAAPVYNAQFYRILPSLNHLRLKQNDTDSVGDIELCFIFLYGIMALNMQKAEIGAETKRVKEEIGRFALLLNNYYQQYQNGELALDE